MDTTIDFKERLDRRLKSGSLRSKTVGSRVTEPEEQELIAAASRDGCNISEWVRDVLLHEARRPKDDVFFTELIATRMLLLNILRGLAMGEKFTPEQFGKLTEKVRAEKRKVAREVMEQYSANQPKE